MSGGRSTLYLFETDYDIRAVWLVTTPERREGGFAAVFRTHDGSVDERRSQSIDTRDQTSQRVKRQAPQVTTSFIHDVAAVKRWHRCDLGCLCERAIRLQMVTSGR